MAAFTVGATGCGQSAGPTSSSSGSSAGVLEAKQLVATEEKMLDTWPAPGPAFDASKARGKLIWYISGDLSSEFEHQLTQGMSEAAQAVGARFTAIDGKGQAAEYARAVDEGVAQHANVIVLGGVQPQVVAPQLADAKKAGIPVIAGHEADPGVTVPNEDPSVVAYAAHCIGCAGKMVGDFLVADSNGKVNAVVFSVSAFGPFIAGEVKGIQDEVNRLCQGCKIKIVDVSLPQLNNVGDLASSLLRQDPTINYLVPAYDQLALFMIPAVHALGRQGSVKIVSTNAAPGVLKFMADHDVVVGDVGDPTVWQGWGFGDQAIRVVSGTTPVSDIKAPLRMIDTSNIASIDLKADPTTWYWSGDFRAAYKQLWGVK